MNIEKTPLGYEIKNSHVTYFFGGKESQIQNLKVAYPHFDFVRVKQTHSDIVVESKDASLDYQVNADGHISTARYLALCVVTADCVPALFYHAKSGTIAGVHAGWRGVANRILINTIRDMVKRGIPPQEIEVAIGPHIQKDSFEVGHDVRDQILASLPEMSREEKEMFYTDLSTEKSLVDINLIVKAQLESQGISLENVSTLHIDTVKDQFFHSHRRDKEQAGRQISFVVRTP
ncbi:peptidoglycan editing factor PgeF [Bdellovibrio sp. HCB185ZH]|uniref:peptidoglycan editing factor PgeF n=1 Tax=Bdellovibrio sp. HCB185ZH TaxID=3394235 RepID=UPI0039A5A9B5